MELLHTLFKAVNSNKLFLRCRFAVSSMTSQRAALARPPSPNKKRCCTSKDNTEEHGHTTQDMQVKHIDSDSSWVSIIVIQSGELLWQGKGRLARLYFYTTAAQVQHENCLQIQQMQSWMHEAITSESPVLFRCFVFKWYQVFNLIKSHTTF